MTPKAKRVIRIIFFVIFKIADAIRRRKEKKKNEE